jgi:hypothetical protein
MSAEVPPAGVRPYRLVITFEAPLARSTEEVQAIATAVGQAAADTLAAELAGSAVPFRANVAVQIRGD